MDREKIINDINKLIDEIVGMIKDEGDLIAFKKTLTQVLILSNMKKELAERLKVEEND